MMKSETFISEEFYPAGGTEGVPSPCSRAIVKYFVDRKMNHPAKTFLIIYPADFLFYNFFAFDHIGLQYTGIYYAI